MGALIAARRADGIPVAVACRALGVSRSWFYQQTSRRPGPRAQRREQLKAEVARLFGLHAGEYGSPRITADLRNDGWRVSENTVAGLMRELGLAARRKNKRKRTTRPGKGRWRAPDLVKRDFPAEKINRKWYDDGTEIPTWKRRCLPVGGVRMRGDVGFGIRRHHRVRGGWVRSRVSRGRG